ncbi:MAG: hypothetical protein AAB400_03510 [Patescibacteria group bacterium]
MMSENALKLSIPHCVDSIILAVTVTIQELNQPSRAGGFVSLFDFFDPAPHLILKVGSFEQSEPGRGEACFNYSQEKGRRLQQYPDHVSSFQSRNPDEKKWGGAVRGNRVILSFSGLPEILDELAMVRAGLELGLFPDYDRIRKIADASDNAMIRDILASFAA